MVDIVGPFFFYKWQEGSCLLTVYASSAQLHDSVSYSPHLEPRKDQPAEHGVADEPCFYLSCGSVTGNAAQRPD